MKDNFRNTVVLSVISCMLSAVSSISYAEGAVSYKTGMSQVNISNEAEVLDLSDDTEKTKDNIQTEGNDEDKAVLLEPGVYFIYGAKQLRITDADNEVLLFKGKQPDTEALRVELPPGGRLEYMGKLYMTRADKSENDSAHEGFGTKAITINPFEYSPIFSMSLFSLEPGGYIEVTEGNLNIYNKSIELKNKVCIPYISSISGYILNEGIGSDNSAQEEELEGETIAMESGRNYTVGTDLKESKYIARGSGTVRVYDPDGYVKTVIKLKKTDAQGDEGVESYRFDLAVNNTVIIEGSIEFTEIYKEHINQ